MWILKDREISVEWKQKCYTKKKKRDDNVDVAK